MFQKVKTHFENVSVRRILRVMLIIVLCVLSAFSVSVLQNAVRTYQIADGKTHFVVRSVSDNLPEVLDNTDLAYDHYRILSSATAENVTTVEIEYLFPVYITVGKETQEFLTTGGTVESVLNDAGYSVDSFDLIQPAANVAVAETVYIDYTNIDYKTVSKTETIAHGTKTVKSNKLAKGKKTVTKGADGLRQIDYKVKYVNGVESGRTEVANTVLKKPVDTVNTVGTYVAPKPKKTTTTTSSKLSPKQRVLAAVGNVAIKYYNNVKAVSKLLPTQTVTLDKNNRPVNYTKKITVQATAYTHTGHNCATGVKPTPGYIAVSPKVIPYGTKMFIVSKDGKYVYGYAIAADTGGFAKTRPNNVDLFFDTRAECYSFGRRDVDIYFLP